MQTQRVFTNVDDEVLEARIRCATGRIVYVAPGISVRVARALAHRAVAGDGAEISVVLDVDAEVCRLGYGDLAGLETIKAAMEQTGRRVWHQAGIRMGLLICDEDVLVYAPTPLLIEAGSGVPEKPNGVLLEEGKTAAVEDACGVSGDAARQEVGLDPLPDTGEVRRDLERNPPQRFDVSRAIRVFNSRVQYVEVEFTGYRLSLRQVQVPAELLGLASDVQMAARWQNTFRLFAPNAQFAWRHEYRDENGNPRDEVVTEQSLSRERTALKRRYLKEIPGGTAILRAHVDDFDAAMATLKERADGFADAVRTQVAEEIKSSTKNLLAEIWPHMKGKPRLSLGWSQLTEEQQKAALAEDLQALMRKAAGEYEPKLVWRYKEVSCDSLEDEEFVAALRKAYGKESKRLFSEYEAAPVCEADTA